MISLNADLNKGEIASLKLPEANLITMGLKLSKFEGFNKIAWRI